MQVQSLGQEDPLEEGRVTHSSKLACRIPWVEEPGGLESIESQRVGHDWSDLTGTASYIIGKNTSRMGLNYKPEGESFTLHKALHVVGEHRVPLGSIFSSTYLQTIKYLTEGKSKSPSA